MKSRKPSFLRGVDLSSVSDLEHLIDYYQKMHSLTYNKVREREVALQEANHQLEAYYQNLEKLHKLHAAALRKEHK